MYALNKKLITHIPIELILVRPLQNTHITDSTIAERIQGLLVVRAIMRRCCLLYAIKLDHHCTLLLSGLINLRGHTANEELPPALLNCR